MYSVYRHYFFQYEINKSQLQVNRNIGFISLVFFYTFLVTGVVHILFMSVILASFTVIVVFLDGSF